ncbi:cbb3-type cytochrome c oxidase subunit 3 [Phenylobacterium aquaticum]|uniref:cbb3-type cytochrome c oxidase subunit 3 n=1 Tax=Phenylobacterium aquaticum TaxID=1763816 RepID=UPI001F5D0E86|nr:cbb3-type cytochrome c oxidase subunit 3 [Phenylobacterium aquaticum]MCI3134369.1 cbb3-type cytochrome c oxidase subunit 3 [Phenylobacterium aquaticum]
MSALTYETVARAAQQGGTVYFAILFLGGLVYALWPRNREAFNRLAHVPLEQEDDDVPA